MILGSPTFHVTPIVILGGPTFNLTPSVILGGPVPCPMFLQTSIVILGSLVESGKKMT